jgi:hypothetical protein
VAQTWTARTTPWDSGFGIANHGVWSPTLKLFVVVGANSALTKTIMTSPDGIVWTERTNSLDSLGGALGNSVAWSPSLALFVMVADTTSSWGGNAAHFISTSPDGITWTSRTSSHDGSNNAAPLCVAWSADQSLFVIGWFRNNGAVTNAISTSPDGVTWTAHSTPFDGTSAHNGVYGVAWCPGIGGGLWVASGSNTAFNRSVMTSPDGTTWTAQAGAPSPVSGHISGVGYSPLLTKGFVAGSFIPGQLLSTANGTTYTDVSPSGLNNGTDMIEANGMQFVCGQLATGRSGIYEATDGATWTQDTVPSGNIVDGFGGYAPSLGRLVACSDFSGAGGSPFVIATAEVGPAPPPPVGVRFFQGYQWRFIAADIPTPLNSSGTGGGVVTSWMNGLMHNRVMTFTLDQPSTFEFDVDPDSRQVNEIFVPDADPRLAQSNRVIYGFRREGLIDSVGPWQCRGAWIVMSPEDQGNADIPTSHVTCYDPWKYLEGRPVVDSLGNLPNDTTRYASTPPYNWFTGDQIVTGALKNTIDAVDSPGGFCFIDAGAAHGGTAFYGGTIEATANVVYEIGPGTTVAQVWTDMVNTGTLDIVLTPIYDPINRPGYTHELSVYTMAGEQRPSCVFSWGQFQRNLVDIDRAHDGTPGNFSNLLLWWSGAGGVQIPATIENSQSVEKYLPYWNLNFNPSQSLYMSGAGLTSVVALAEQTLVLQKQGLRTLTVHPTPERSPIPITDYDIGDRVLVFAPKRLRAAITSSFDQNNTAFRVQMYPISLDDNGIETVDGLLLSPDYRTEGS